MVVHAGVYDDKHIHNDHYIDINIDINDKYQYVNVDIDINIDLDHDDRIIYGGYTFF